MNNYYIIAIIIVIIVSVCIILICFFSSTSSKNNSIYLNGKLVEYSGMFRKASNLNIGHDKNAPIFHARPYFENLNTDLKGTYFNTLKIDVDEAVYIDFPVMKNTPLFYEVNVFEYPNWEQIDDTYFSPTHISIGTSIYNNITVKRNKEILILITGFMDDKLMRNWLSKCKVYYDTNNNNTMQSISKKIDYPLNSDSQYLDDIKYQYEVFIQDFINVNPNYKIK